MKGIIRISLYFADMTSGNQLRLTWVYFMALVYIGFKGAVSSSIEGVVARQNVGVVFRLHHKPLLLNIGHIDLTLTMPYSVEPPLLRNMSGSLELIDMISNTSLPHLQHLADLSQMLDNMTLTLYKECMGVYTDISKVLGNPRHTTYARQTREFIQYITPIPTGFIGLAKQQAVDILYQHLLTVDRALNTKDDKRLATDRVVRLLSSRQLDIKKALNHESERISKIVSYVNGTFTAIAKTIGKVTTDHIHELHLENAVFSVFLAIIADLLSMGHYIDRYSPFLEAIITLNAGTLPHQLVSQADARAAYRNMSLFLGERFNGTDHEGISLTPLTEQELFDTGLVTFMYTREHLYAHLRVPTFHPREKMQLYSVDIMPVPFHTNNASAPGYTILQINSDRFAQAPLVGHHVSFTAGKIAHCTDSRHYIMCDFPLATRPAKFGTCMSSIFQGDQITDIQKLCTFKAFPKAHTPSTAVSLGNNNFALSTGFESYTTVCRANTAIRKKPCGFCIVSLPPACTLSLPDLQISSTPMGVNRSLIVETHAVNLPLALAFDISVEELNAAFTHTAPIALDLPSLSMDKLDALPFSQQDLDQGVDLTAMATAIQEFDKLSAAHRASKAFVTTVSNPITNTVVLIINILIILALIVVSKKLWTMSTTLAALHQAVSLIQPADAGPANLSDIMILSRKSPSTPAEFDLKQTIDYETHLLAAILGLLIIGLITKLLRFVTLHLWLNPSREEAQTANPSLHLKIYTDSTNYIFPLISFKAEASSLNFIEVPILTKITYTGGQSAALTWSRPLTLAINNRHASLKLCSTVVVPRLIRSKLQMALKTANTEDNGLLSALLLRAAGQMGVQISSNPNHMSENHTPTVRPVSMHEQSDPTAETDGHLEHGCTAPLKPNQLPHPAIIDVQQDNEAGTTMAPTYRMLRAIIRTMDSQGCKVEMA